MDPPIADCCFPAPPVLELDPEGNVVRTWGGPGEGYTWYDQQFSRDPEQSILYLVDGTNQRIWLLRREDLKILDRFGRPGRQYGQFIRAHMLAIDSSNRIYTGEAGDGRRIQRWVLKGTRPASSVEPPGL